MWPAYAAMRLRAALPAVGYPPERLGIGEAGAACASVPGMNDADLERAIRQAGYDIRWEATPNGNSVYALRDGKRHTRAHATLLSLAQYLGRVDRPVLFVADSEAAIVISPGRGDGR